MNYTHPDPPNELVKNIYPSPSHPPSTYLHQKKTTIPSPLCSTIKNKFYGRKLTPLPLLFAHVKSTTKINLNLPPPPLQRFKKYPKPLTLPPSTIKSKKKFLVE
jgi:hypothetical protein